MTKTRVDGVRGGVAACAVSLLAACSAGDSPPPPAQPFTDPGYVDGGDHRLHYALTQTTDLPSEIAGSYGIVQRNNLALLTIALVARDGSLAETAGLEASAVSLTGLRRPLALVRHDSATGPTWLAPVEIRDREAVTIEIRARAPAAGPEIEARFTRAFHLE